MRYRLLISICLAGMATAAVPETELLQKLQSPETSVDQKKAICRQLETIGTDAAVPALAALFADKELGYLSRRAVQGWESSKIDDALRAELANATGGPQLGIIQTISARRDAKAVTPLSTLAKSPDSQLVCAAISALGEIGTADAANVLKSLSVTAEQKPLLWDALLKCADQGVPDVYPALSKEPLPPIIRVGVLRGLVVTEKDPIKATQMVVSMMTDEELKVRRAGALLAKQIPGEAATLAFAAELSKIDADIAVALLNSLRERQDKAAIPAVMQAAKASDESVRVAAIQVLGELGDGSAVPLLISLCNGRDAAGNAAQKSLGLIYGAGVEEALAECTRSSDEATRLGAVRAIAMRAQPTSAGILLEAIEDPSAEVRKEAWKGFKDLADETQLPQMLSLMKKADPVDSKSIEQALLAVGRNSKAPEKVTALFADALPGASVSTRCSLVYLLGRFPEKGALEAI